MTRQDDTWTTSELERYLDGDLPDDLAAALNGALRTSPELRAVLERVRAADGAVRAAMGVVPSRRVTTIRWARVGLAACVLIVGVVAVLTSGAPRRNPVSPAGDGRVVQEVAPSRVRIVMTLAARPGGTSNGEARAGAEGESGSGEPVDAAALRRALAHGHVEQALELIRDSEGRDRLEACRAVGQVLASAWTAERLLDGLEPLDRLHVCRAWAVDQRFLPETFGHLALLSHEESIRDEFERVMGELAMHRSLHVWIRNHGLAASGGTGAPRG